MNYPVASPYRFIKDIGGLSTDRQIFLSNGEPFGVRGITAFNLLDKFSKNQNILSFLQKYPSSNLVRIFLYTTGTWAPNDWNIPEPHMVADFVDYMKIQGYYVKLVLHTDDKFIPDRNQSVIKLVEYLTTQKLSNLLLAAGNEPLTHKNIDVEELHTLLQNSGYLYTSGVYEDLHKFYGNYGDIHTGRDVEWPRKAKDGIEAYRGGGPNDQSEPACKVPWIMGEPIKPSEAQSYGNSLYCVRDYYSYGALARLSSGGVLFHCESAKLTNNPTEFEEDCYRFMMLGYEKFPPDAAFGNYIHHQELEDNLNKALRVFSVGKWAVVIRPNNFIAPSNWKPMDEWSVCWEIL